MSEKDLKKANKKIKELEKKIEQLEKEVGTLNIQKQDIFEQLQRVSADYANFQKRSPKQIADSVVFEKKAILRSLLPSIDNFDHLLSHASTATESQAENLVKGIQLIFDHILDALKAHGVKRIDALGKPFDPNLHEAMMRQSDQDAEDNTVLEVYQPGYMLGDQVLRPSKVVVNKIETGKAEEPEKVQEEEEEEKKTPETDNTAETNDESTHPEAQES